MLAEPSGCGGYRERELAEIGIEMAARNQGKAFGLQRALIGGKCQIGDPTSPGRSPPLVPKLR